MNVEEYEQLKKLRENEQKRKEQQRKENLYYRTRDLEDENKGETPDPLKAFQNYMRERKATHPEETYKQRLNNYRISKGKKVEDINDDYTLDKKVKKIESGKKISTPKNRNRRKMLSKKINEFFAASSSSGIQNEIKN